jgi:glyoxylase-like metal-dependent hydrolase (beta-lactamase superfamily II)
VRKPTRRREVGRGERVMPGIWRLRLPLPWPGVPHCNAWALSAGSGIVLVDTGVHEPGSLAHLERALDQAGLRLDLVRLVVCTHAHIDHCGEAPRIRERNGCEVWLHPNRSHLRVASQDPEAALAQRAEIARQSGVPEAPLKRWIEQRRASGTGLSGELVSDRDLLPGVEVESDVGTWQVIETPGHAPSHVCLHQPEQRLLISGDHLLGRVSQYFDVGYTPDPVGEFLRSLDVVEGLDARLALAGHARPFTDLPGHIQANRDRLARDLATVRAALRSGASTAYEVARAVYGEHFTEELAAWQMTMTTAWLTHLEAAGEAARAREDTAERWDLSPQP